MKKILPLGLISILLAFIIFPVSPVFAECADNDGDRYYSCDNIDDELPPFAKGSEELRCDQATIDENSDDYDLVISPEITSIAGNKVHPGAIEPPNSQVDLNCDGKITGYLPEGREGGTDFFELMEKVIVLIGQVAVFISVGALVYGGIMFATASGEERKLQKAKKTIVGAVVGLIIGLIAWNIVGFVTGIFG